MKLDAYFERIGYRGAAAPDIETLRELHLLHPCAIPFENLSTLLREPVPLTIAALEDKLIRRRRGGYCFEHNALFRHVLEAIGFELTPLAARVVWNPEYANPRSHMALLVEASGKRWLCDVGFGGVTLTAPLHYGSDASQNTPHESFRIRATGAESELQVLLGGEWRPVYRFDLQPQQAIDYEAMNFYVSAHPDSHFLDLLMAGRPDIGERYSLGGNQFCSYRSGVLIERRTLTSAASLRALLAEQFHIELPDHPDFQALLERVVSAPEI